MYIESRSLSITKLNSRAPYTGVLDVPLDSATSDSDTTFQAVNGLAVDTILICDLTLKKLIHGGNHHCKRWIYRAQKTMVALHNIVTSIEKQESSSTKRTLGLASPEAFVAD